MLLILVYFVLYLKKVVLLGIDSCSYTAKLQSHEAAPRAWPAPHLLHPSTRCSTAELLSDTRRATPIRRIVSQPRPRPLPYTCHTASCHCVLKLDACTRCADAASRHVTSPRSFNTLVPGAPRQLVIGPFSVPLFGVWYLTRLLVCGTFWCVVLDGT